MNNFDELKCISIVSC